MKGTEAVVERLASHAPPDIAIPQPVIAEVAYRIEDFDAAIAAHAVAAGATLVTADTAHMARVPGLRIEDWTR